MQNAILQGDAQTIEKMIITDDIDVNAVITVSIIITSYNFTCTNCDCLSKNQHSLHLQLWLLNGS